MKNLLNPGRENWAYYNMANCYQFAIGYRHDMLNKLMPGQLAGHTVPEGYRYTDEMLVRAVQEDLKSMGYVIEPCDKDTKLSEGEWEICILNGSVESFEYDFHFVMRLESGGDWLQKYHRDQLIEIVPSPERCTSNYVYHGVGYYKIRKVEE